MTNRPHTPILLAHGIARFDAVRAALGRQLQPLGVELDDGGHYFRGIKSHLEAHGFNVHHGAVSFAARVDTRARELADEVRRVLAATGADQLHLIAHSMGGLDARHMIVDVPGMAERVASLTTIGTPHLGTAWADVALAWGGETLITALKGVLDLEGCRDLTTTACAAFNARAQDGEARNGVRYQAVASAQERSATFFPLQGSWLVIDAKEGANDGLVSVKSQLWQKELAAGDGTRKAVKQRQFPFPADHLGQIGWWNPSLWKPSDGIASLREQIETYERGVLDVYLEIAKELRDGEAVNLG
jgi:triacylglycerol lipase